MYGKTFALVAAAVATVLTTAASASAADRYLIDPQHTFPSLEFSHLGISVWRGKFNKTSGEIVLDRAAKTGTVDVTVDTDSIDFGLESMHERARTEKWFNVEKHPTATYKGTVKFAGDTPKSVDGQLTLLGVTRPVKLAINNFKCIPHPLTKKELCGADAEGELLWSHFGMAKMKYAEGDTDKVVLRIQVEGIKQD